MDRPQAPIASDAYDPSPTLAVHCGIVLLPSLSPIKVLFGVDTMLAPELGCGYAAT
jgi:hypothetical protein